MPKILDKETHDLVTDCISFLDSPQLRAKLNDFEMDFLTGRGPNNQYDSLKEKFDKYGEELQLSPKQVAVLQRMYDKVINDVKPNFKNR